MRHLWRHSIICGLILAGCAQETPIAEPKTIKARELLIQSCSGCHHAANETIADIITLSETDMLASLQLYKSGQSGNTVMHRLMRGYTDSEIELLAKTLGTNDD